MGDPHDEYEKLVILDNVDDPEVTFTNPMQGLGGALELDGAGRARLFFELLEPIVNPDLDLAIELLDLSS